MVGRETGEPQAAKLSHRNGLLVRMRARVGLLPGDVSTAAMLKARQIRRIAVLLAILVGFFALLFPLALLAAEPGDEPAVVTTVLGPEDLRPGLGPYRVALDTGASIVFDDDPEVAAGETVLVRGYENAPDGLVVNGEFVPLIAAHPA